MSVKKKSRSQPVNFLQNKSKVLHKQYFLWFLFDNKNFSLDQNIKTRNDWLPVMCRWYCLFYCVTRNNICHIVCSIVQADIIYLIIVCSIVQPEITSLNVSSFFVKLETAFVNSVDLIVHQWPNIVARLITVYSLKLYHY